VSAIIGRLSFDRAEILARTVLDQMLDASATGTLETRSVFAVPGTPSKRIWPPHNMLVSINSITRS